MITSDVHEEHATFIEDMLSSPKLKRVQLDRIEFTYMPPVFSLLSTCMNLRVVKLRLSLRPRSMHAQRFMYHRVFDELRKLDLSEIDIFCELDKCRGYACHFARLIHVHSKDVFPHLQKLRLNCMLGDVKFFYSCIPHFSHLKDVTVTHRMNEACVQWLRHVPAVRLRNACCADVAAQLGGNVVEYTRSGYMRGVEIRLLEACPALQVIDLALAPGSEIQLVSLPLCHLREITLAWDVDMFQQKCHFAFQYDIHSYVSFLKRNPSLRKVCLHTVHVRLRDILHTLDLFKGQLEVFAYNIEVTPRSDALLTLIAIVETAATLCSGLREFRAPLRCFSVAVSEKRLFESVGGKIGQLASRLGTAVSRLRRRAPLVDVQHIQGVVDRMRLVEECRRGGEQSENAKTEISHSRMLRDHRENW